MKQQKDFSELEKAIDYEFTDKELLTTALSHSSFSNESKGEVLNNERLEFLGDSILSLIVSDFLFRNFHVPEGELTKLRASLVCEQSLYEFALETELGDYILLGHGERQNGGAERASILSDTFEAIIAAIYLDSGIDDARNFVIPFVEKMLSGDNTEIFKDYKTILQEIIQNNPEEVIAYKLVEENGPDHDKEFAVDLYLNSNIIGKGKGKSKKLAEQESAKQALELMGH